MKAAFQGVHGAYSEPTIADGVVYVTDQADPAQLHAIDATTGATRWTRGSTGHGFTGTAVVENGVVFVNGQDGKVHALDAGSGAPRWTAAAACSERSWASASRSPRSGSSCAASTSPASRWRRGPCSGHVFTCWKSWGASASK